MKIIVLGCGSIGERHIRNLLSLNLLDKDGIMAVDLSKNRLEEVKRKYGVKITDSLDGALSTTPDGILICTPSSLHLEGALKAARAGVNLFIEKPISHTLDGIDNLTSIVEEKKLVTLLGCNLKFHPSFILMRRLIDEGAVGKVLSVRCQSGQYLPDWHPWEDYRKGYSANASLGGGVLLDSHAFNYLTWFLGDIECVSCFTDKLSNLEIDTEDTAAVLLRFDRGSIGEVHLDYTQRARQRNYESFGEQGTIKWDLLEKNVKLFKSDAKQWKIYNEDKNYDFNQTYIDEMKHFIDCIRGKDTSITDIQEATKVLKVILSAKESSKTGKAVTLKGSSFKLSFHE